jgi:hypothetical protein
MKWKTLLLSLIILILLPLISAGNITLPQSSIAPGETFMAYIETGSLTSSQISVLDESFSSVSISPLVTKYRDNNYFVYFNLPSELEDGKYDFYAGSDSKNFSIVSSSKVIQIKPGIIELDSASSSFSIEIKNIGESLTTLITSSYSEITPRKSTLDISSGSTKKLFADYSYEKINQDSILTITYGSKYYSIPIIYPDLFKNDDEEVTPESNDTVILDTQNNTIQIEDSNLTIEDTIDEALTFLVNSTEAKIETTSNKTKEAFLMVQNNLDINLELLTWELTGNLEDVTTLNETTVNVLGPGEIYTQYLWFNLEQNARLGTYFGELIATSANYSTSIPITITISESKIEEAINETVEEPIIESTEPAIQPTVNFNEKKKEDSSSSNGPMIVGIALIFMLLGVFIVIALKLRQKNVKQFEKYIEETKKK